MENQPEPNEKCWCGCGGKTGRGSHFCSGHDSKALAAVIRAEYGSIAGLLEAHGYGPGGPDGGAEPAWQETEEGLGFKRLTPENWLEPDSVMRAFVHGAISGEPYVPSGEERVRDIMQIELTEDVSLDVRQLFAVARGALCYGYFFYPLYALASEQLLRVAETAVTRKYEALGGPKRARKTPESKPRKATFEDKLKCLKENRLISERDAVWWDAIREARNEASHPQDHHPQDPGHAVDRAVVLAEKVNLLFSV